MTQFEFFYYGGATVLLILILLMGFLSMRSISEHFTKEAEAQNQRRIDITQITNLARGKDPLSFIQKMATKFPQATIDREYDDCVLGTVIMGAATTKILYDRDKIIAKIIANRHLSSQEAEVYFEQNVLFKDGATITNAAYATLI